MREVYSRAQMSSKRALAQVLDEAFENVWPTTGPPDSDMRKAEGDS
ncbi:MAG: hypothetical protein GY812_10885 [Actinomycetia bacterium]|nr:hypothetical protein [Actinomycetes bacterium]